MGRISRLCSLRRWSCLKPVLLLYCLLFLVLYCLLFLGTYSVWDTVSLSRARQLVQNPYIKLVPSSRYVRIGNKPKHVGETETPLCNNSFIGFDKRFALLRNVLLTPSRAKGKMGGNEIEEVINQTEKDELFIPLSGFFTLVCENLTDYRFYKSEHMDSWFKAIIPVPDAKSLTLSPVKISDRWTILVERYEYANLYHTMSDFYNTFLVLQKFKLDPNKVDIVFMDGHPKGAIDQSWSTLFGTVSRAGNLSEPTIYRNLIWNMLGYNSPLVAFKSKSHETPYLEEFRDFFLGRFGLPLVKKLNCSRLTVLIIWRRDYVAHPRNPLGHVTRKIKNEDDLLNAAEETLPNHNIRAIQIDTLSFREQLQVVSEADILVGMHGAGLTHGLFLPKHGGLIELFPSYYGPGNRHFTAMMQWRKMNYISWTNNDKNNEHPQYYTTIPVTVFSAKLQNMAEMVCKSGLIRR